MENNELQRNGVIRRLQVDEVSAIPPFKSAHLLCTAQICGDYERLWIGSNGRPSFSLAAATT
jgi:hypothetical protein